VTLLGEGWVPIQHNVIRTEAYSYPGWRKGQVVSNLCPPGVGVWIGSLITKALARRLDAFDTRSVRKILWIPYTQHIRTLLSGWLPAASSFKYH